MGALLKRFWADHRLATVISLALLFLGLLIKPWTLVLVLVVAFGGPLVGRLESLAASPVSNWRRSQWMGLALLLAAVLLALTGSSGGQGALILALLPVAWVLVTDRSILQGSKEDERASLREPLTLSRAADEDESSAQAETKLDREAAAAEPPERLVGGELLAKIKELGDVGKSDLVRACGYFSQQSDGSERLNFTDFYEALLEAKGFETSINNSDNEDEEEKLDYRLTTAPDGSLLLTNPYTCPLDLQPGDEFDVILGTASIVLTPCDWESDAELADELSALGTEKTWPVTVDNHNNISIPIDALSALGAHPGQQFIVTLGRKIIQLELASNNSSTYDISDLTTIEKRVLAETPTTEVAILHQLLNDRNSYVQAAARRTLNGENNITQTRSLETTASEEDDLSDDWHGLNHDALVLKIENTDQIPPEILEVLASKNYWRVREAVAVHPCTSEAILEKLAQDSDSDVQAALSRRRLPPPWGQLTRDALLDRLRKQPAPLEVLANLAESQSGFVRAAVAANPSATADILEALAGDSFGDVRRAVACAENTPSFVVEALALDEDSEVKNAIALRRMPADWRHLNDDERIRKLAEPLVPPEVLEVLSHSGSWTIRQAVARNRSVEEEILNRLKNDDDSDVASAARDGLLNRKLPQEWRLLDDSDRIDRLKEGTVPLEILELLAISANWRVRQAVARHEGTPDAVLNQLADDDDSDVKQAIEDRRLPVEWRHLDEDERINAIRTTSVNADVLEILAKSPSWRVRQAVASTTRTPLAVLEALSRDQDSDVQRAAKDSLVQSKLPEEWKQLSESEKIQRLTRHHATNDVLELLALSSSIDIRNAIALNSNASIPILLKMKEDTSTRSRIQRLIRHTWAIPESGWQPKHPDEQS